jgi:hypothetical protein
MAVSKKEREKRKKEGREGKGRVEGKQKKMAMVAPENDRFGNSINSNCFD